MSYTPAFAGSTGLVPLFTADASGSSEIDIVTRNASGQSGPIFQSDFDEYVIEVLSVIPATSAASLLLQFSTNGGSSYDTGSNYNWSTLAVAGTASGADGASATTSIILCTKQLSNATSQSASGTFRLTNPAYSGYKQLYGQWLSLDTRNSGANGGITAGQYLSTSAVNACRLLMSSGNITSGSFRIYGVSKQSQVVATAAQGANTLLASFDATSASEVDVTTRNAAGFSGAIFQSDYDEYEVEIVNAIPATNGVSLQLQYSTNGGSSYDTGSNYNWGAHWDGSSSSSTGYDFVNPASAINLNGSTVTVANTAANGGLCGRFRVYNPLSSSLYKRSSIDSLVSYSGSTNFYRLTGHGTYAVTTAVNALRLLFSSGSFTSGTIRVYGISKYPVTGTFPKRATVWPEEFTVTAGGGSITTGTDTSQLHNLTVSISTNTNGDAATGSFYLAAGTYTMSVLGAKTTTKGMIDWYIDGAVAVSGQDWYGSAANNVVQTASVTIAYSGYHTLKLLVNGHNASSSGYSVYLTKIWFKPSAD